MGASDWNYSAYNQQASFVESIDTATPGEGAKALKWYCNNHSGTAWYLRRYIGPDASLFPCKALVAQFAVRLTGSFGQIGNHGLLITPNLLPSGVLANMNSIDGVHIRQGYYNATNNRCCIDWVQNGVPSASISYYERYNTPLLNNNYTQMQVMIVANPFEFEKFGSIRIMYRYAENASLGDPLTEPNPTHVKWGPWRNFQYNIPSGGPEYYENFAPTWAYRSYFTTFWQFIKNMCDNGFYAYLASFANSGFATGGDSNVIYDRIAFDVCTDTW